MVTSQRTLQLVGCLLILVIQSETARSQQSVEPQANRSVLRLDSTSQVELANTQKLLQPKNPFTVELWVRAEPGTYGTLPLIGNFVDHRHPNIQRPDTAGWQLGIRSPDSFQFDSGFFYRRALEKSEGKWCHLAVANDHDGLSIYMNGRRQGEKQPAAKVKWKNSPINFHLGTAEYSRMNRGHQADIGDLRISSTCLYTDEFNPPVVFDKRHDTLVLLDLSNTSDVQVTDRSDHKHHGTIRGTKWISRDADSISMPVYKPIIMGPLGIRYTHSGIVPRYNRWKFKSAATSLQAYARQLDFFKIELGVIGVDEKNVQYASRFSQPTPTTHSDPRDQEKRLYIVRDRGESSTFEDSLLRKSGIDVSSRSVMQFISPELENLLAHVERDYARSQGRAWAKEIEKTTFEMTPQDGGLYFRVVEMQFRPGKN